MFFTISLRKVEELITRICVKYDLHTPRNNTNVTDLIH